MIRPKKEDKLEGYSCFIEKLEGIKSDMEENCIMPLSGYYEHTMPAYNMLKDLINEMKIENSDEEDNIRSYLTEIVILGQYIDKVIDQIDCCADDEVSPQYSGIFADKYCELMNFAKQLKVKYKELLKEYPDKIVKELESQNY